jgi:hypothetical protein
MLGDHPQPERLSGPPVRIANGAAARSDDLRAPREGEGPGRAHCAEDSVAGRGRVGVRRLIGIEVVDQDTGDLLAVALPEGTWADASTLVRVFRRWLVEPSETLDAATEPVKPVETSGHLCGLW